MLTTARRGLCSRGLCRWIIFPLPSAWPLRSLTGLLVCGPLTRFSLSVLDLGGAFTRRGQDSYARVFIWRPNTAGRFHFPVAFLKRIRLNSRAFVLTDPTWRPSNFAILSAL